MKIALIANSTFPIAELFAGGLEKITYVLGHALLKRGFEVHLYAHPDSDTRLNLRKIPTAIDCELSVYQSLSLKEGTDLASVAEQMGYLRTMTEISFGDYDLIHNHSQHYIPIAMGNVLGVPMITSIHTPPLDRLQYASLGIKGNSRMNFTMVSESLSQAWQEWIPEASIVHNGIEMDQWPFIENPEAGYLCWYGRICEEKGTRLAIEAARLAKMPLKIAGPIYDKSYFDHFIRPLIDGVNVEYVGHLNQSEIAPLVGNARATLFTSLWDEPFGLTLIESLACGTPVVAFSGGAVPEILNSTCGMVVPRGEVETMAKAIPKIADINRYSCRNYVESRFSHERMVDAYIKLYSGFTVEQTSLTPHEL